MRSPWPRTMPAIRMMLRGVLPDMVGHATRSDGLRQALPVAERAYLDACEACGRSDLRAKGIPDTTAKAEAPHLETRPPAVQRPHIA